MTRSSDLVMVPREPTDEMLEAGEATFVPGHKGTPVSTPAEVYAAMIAAALQSVPMPERTQAQLAGLDEGLGPMQTVPQAPGGPYPPGPSDAQLTKTPDHDAGNLRSLAAPNPQPHAVSQGWRDDMENAPKEDPNCPGRHFEIMVAGGKYFTTADDWRTRYDHPGWSLAYWDGDGWCGEADEQYGTNYYYEPTHWMLKVAPPPSPENTPRDSSESTTGGAG